MLRFLFESTARPSLRERSEILLYESWELRSEQKIQVMAALDIWNGSGNVFLWQLLNGISEQNLVRVIFALTEWRRLKSSTATASQTLGKYHE